MVTNTDFHITSFEVYFWQHTRRSGIIILAAISTMNASMLLYQRSAF
jgi:hypothetical protein